MEGLCGCFLRSITSGGFDAQVIIARIAVECYRPLGRIEKMAFSAFSCPNKLLSMEVRSLHVGVMVLEL